MTTTFVGIDVSKSTLQIAYSVQNQWHEKTIDNTIESIEPWFKELEISTHNYYFVLEYTGTYSNKLLYMLCKSQCNVSMVTPTQISSYAKSKNISTKNDRSDARLLVRYANNNQSELVLYKFPSITTFQLDQTMRTIAQIEKHLSIQKNQQHAYFQLHPELRDPCIENTYTQSIDLLEKQIEDLNQRVKELLSPQSNEKQEIDLIQSVVGIGPKTSNTLISLIGSVHRFETADKLAKFSGVSPSEYRSGTSVKGKGSIVKGKGKLCSLLYMASLSAIRYNHACNALYTRLRAKGKCQKVAIIAVAHLLIRQMFAVVTKNKSFDNEYYKKNLLKIATI